MSTAKGYDCRLHIGGVEIDAKLIGIEVHPADRDEASREIGADVVLTLHSMRPCDLRVIPAPSRN